jgi:hypothetical protein
MYGALKSAYWLYVGAWLAATSRRPVGTNIYDEEWDALFVLDGCRTDLLSEVAHEYTFVTEIDSRRSVGSMSSEWLANTFRQEYRSEIQETAYITANPFTEDVLVGDRLKRLPKVMSTPFGRDWHVVNESEFGLLDEVWRYGWNEDWGTVHPRTVTDRVIQVGRESGFERLIVHYMQPHQPFIADGHDLTPTVGRGAFQDNSSSGNIWSSVRAGEYSFETAWRAYRANLEMVLEEVSLLLKNLDAETVVITADHGNAVGEWGVHGHPAGFPHPAVKRVPWVETTAHDSEGYEPEVSMSTDIEMRTEDHLRDLGYL